VQSEEPNTVLSPEEAEAKGMYFHDGKWLTQAEAKDVLDRYYVSRDVRRLANYYYILVGSVGFVVCLVFTYFAFTRIEMPSEGELSRNAIFAVTCAIAVIIGVGLRKFRIWARKLGLVFYPALIAGLFVVLLFTGRLTGQVLAGLALVVPLAVSFGVLSYLTLYGTGAGKIFEQSEKNVKIQ